MIYGAMEAGFGLGLGLSIGSSLARFVAVRAARLFRTALGNQEERL